MNELEKLKQIIQEKDKIIKDLTLQLIGYKKENKNIKNINHKYRY